MADDPTTTAATEKAAFRAVGLAIGALLALAGCSITSGPSNVEHMRCVAAHDEWHDSGGVQTVCDLYEPEPTRG